MEKTSRKAKKKPIKLRFSRALGCAHRTAQSFQWQPPITGHSEAHAAVGISPLNGNSGTMAAHALLVKREILGVGRYAVPFIREILPEAFPSVSRQ